MNNNEDFLSNELRKLREEQLSKQQKIDEKYPELISPYRNFFINLGRYINSGTVMIIVIVFILASLIVHGFITDSNCMKTHCPTGMKPIWAKGRWVTECICAVKPLDK